MDTLIVENFCFNFEESSRTTMIWSSSKYVSETKLASQRFLYSNIHKVQGKKSNLPVVMDQTRDIQNICN